MWEKEFIEGVHIRCVTGWTCEEANNRFEITFVNGRDVNECYPRYDIYNPNTNEWYEGCYLNNGSWSPIFE